MALPPPRPAPELSLSAEEERAKLDAAHKANVDELERLLDVSLKGKRPQHGQTVELHLPVGPGAAGTHTPQVIADIEARYSAHWSQASVPRAVDADGKPIANQPKQDKHGRYTLTLVP